MHPEVRETDPGICPKCGMTLVEFEEKNTDEYSTYTGHGMTHTMKRGENVSWWEKFKMSMTMSMGMEHTGLAGQEMAKLMEEDIRRKFFFALFLTLPIVAYSPLGEKILGLTLPTPIAGPWLLFLLTTPVFFYSGWIFLYSSYQALRKRTLNMAVLIAVGITAAYGFSIVLALVGSTDSFYEAAAMLVTFVLFGHWMEMKSRRGTTDALRALLDLVPPQARVIRDGKEQVVATSEVRVGDTLLLKPGDKVPVDGVVLEGESAIDESLVTGESFPVTKKSGDVIVGGSINQNGSLQFRATKVGDETALAQIMKLVETAQNSKAPGQRIADRFSAYLVVFAIGAGVLTFLVWYFVLGETLVIALTFAISAIVIACPDALGLATPTAVAVGTGLGAKHNILIKDATTLEQASKITAIALDKTGTLTEGKPKVTDMIVVNNFTEEELLAVVAATEMRSNHPLARAILGEAKAKKIVLPERVKNFISLSGLGIEAEVDGKKISIGTRRLLIQRKISLGDLESRVKLLEEDGKTLMFVAIDGKAAGVVAVADPIKETAKLAIEGMKRLGIEVALISGDNQKTVEAIGKKLGIERLFAEIFPEDKARYVKSLQEEGKFVAMVGDGVNDAPALAQANIGIAIGAGTDVAIETANIVLMKSDPADILRAIRLSKATVRKMKQNLFWASIYNILAVPIAAGVLYPAYGISLRPEVSALLMSASSIIVATNAVLLKRAERELIMV